MRARLSRFAVLLPSLSLVGACAVGADLPQEAQPLISAPVDSGPQGPEQGSIRPDAAARIDTPTPTPEAGTTVDAAPPVDQDAAPAIDAGQTPPPDAGTTPPPPPPPPPPPTTPVCDQSYGAQLIIMIAAGITPPPCQAGACSSGFCCYQGQYCMIQ